MNNLIGQIISHYRILDLVGQGGMGVVYRAHDTELDRMVALKFLPHGPTAGESEQARFLQEAKAASALNHPNICTIHALGEHEGERFIVMEFVDGKTLRAIVPVKTLQDVIGYAVQIAEALQEAHSHGIVHRDVKADNIMVNTKNQVKVMDFGLAKLKGALRLTKTSSTIGTLAYMAPEQIQGGEVDARSDIFSFGIVLYEMLTGHLPFRGEHEAAMVYSIVHEPPDSVLKYRHDSPPDLERIIHRALEKEPEDRYQHVDDMVSELRRIQKQSMKVSRASPASAQIPENLHTPPGRETEGAALTPMLIKRPRLIGGMLVAVAIAAVGSYFLFFMTPKAIDSLAVLPFVNVSGDPNTEYLSDGITESLINGLSRLSNLSVMSRSSVFHYKGKETDPQAAGKQLGVRAVLTGRVTQRGQDLIVSTELVDVASNHHIWGDQYKRTLSDILTVQEDIAREISKNLRFTLSGEEQKRLAERSTDNIEAYQLYLKGRFHWNKRTAGDLQKAVDYFDQAIQKDPDYALAYAGLALTYVLLPEYAALNLMRVFPKAEAAARRAIELDPTLAEPHTVLGHTSARRWDCGEAEREYKRAIELNPNYATTYQWYSECLRQRGQLDQSLAMIRRAQELDPLSLVIGWNVAEVLGLMKRNDQALEQYRKLLELDPNFPGTHAGLGVLYARQGKFQEAIKELQTVRQMLRPDDVYTIESLGYVYAKSGKKEEALNILDRLLTLAKRGSSVSGQIAMVYTGLGDKEKAFEWIERGYEDYDYLIGFLKVYPEFDDLRADPRFTVLLKKMGLQN